MLPARDPVRPSSRRNRLSQCTRLLPRAGICLDFADLLLSSGCNVVIADLKLRPESEALLAVYNGAAAGSARGVFVKTDVTAWDDLRDVFTKAVAEFGSFEIVCPGAGIFEPSWSSFWRPPGTNVSRDFLDANHYTTLDVNLIHPIRTTQLAIQHWTKAENAKKQTPETPKRVVQIASIAGYAPSLVNPLYAVSKYGIVGFTRSMANLDAGLGIRINAIAPGIVRTPLWTDHPEKLAYLEEDRKDWITGREVAAAMLTLLESEDHAGGTVLEIGKNTLRKVATYNDPGPDFTPGQGMMPPNMAQSGVDIIKTLQDGSWQASADPAL